MGGFFFPCFFFLRSGHLQEVRRVCIQSLFLLSVPLCRRRVYIYVRGRRWRGGREREREPERKRVLLFTMYLAFSKGGRGSPPSFSPFSSSSSSGATTKKACVSPLSAFSSSSRTTPPRRRRQDREEVQRATVQTRTLASVRAKRIPLRARRRAKAAEASMEEVVT